MKIGLYFGSFNPIHIGHLIIANHVLNNTDLKKVWFVVSPQNPLKPSHSLLNEYDRLHLVRIATEENQAFTASDVEFKLPRPSYTIDTLTYLKEKNPADEFSVIMGSDSFQNISKWKNHQQLLSENNIVIYSRPGFEVSKTAENVIMLADAPLLEISSTMIRSYIKQGKSIKYLVSESVEKEIINSGYYRK